MLDRGGVDAHTDLFLSGELVDAEVFVEVFEVVFLDPAVEDQVHAFMDGGCIRSGRGGGRVRCCAGG